MFDKIFGPKRLADGAAAFALLRQHARGESLAVMVLDLIDARDFYAGLSSERGAAIQLALDERDAALAKAAHPMSNRPRDAKGHFLKVEA